MILTDLILSKKYIGKLLFIKFFLILLLASIFLVACVQIRLTKHARLEEQLEQFSALTIESTTIALSGLKAVRVVDLEKSAILTARHDELAEVDFQPILNRQDIQSRFTALHTLDAYAQALARISTAYNVNDINKVAEDFEGTVKNIFSALEVEDKFSEKAGSISSKIVKHFLKAVVDKNKEEAIKDALINTDPSINELCELILTEFQIYGPFYDSVENSYRRLQTSVNERFMNAKQKAEKLKLAQEFGQLIQKKEEILIFFEAISLCFKKISVAHHALMLQATSGASSRVALTSLSAQINNAYIYYDVFVRN